MKVRIDPDSSVPPYEQLRNKLISDIETGKLAPETRLPSVRSLAADLGLAANTVARTYRELESEGYVRTAGRHGTTVLATHSPEDAPALAATTQYVDELDRLGVDVDTAIRLVRRAFLELDEDSTE